jgi:hypothetical protein
LFSETVGKNKVLLVVEQFIHSLVIMGGETNLYVVYGFLEDRRVIQFPNTVDIGLYADAHYSEQVYYGVCPHDCSGEEITAQFLLNHEQRKQADTHFQSHGKVLMDTFAEWRGKTAKWIVVVGGDIECYARLEEDDGYD